MSSRSRRRPWSGHRSARERLWRLAREIAATKHVSLRTYTGLEYTSSGVQNIRAVFLLWPWPAIWMSPEVCSSHPAAPSYRTEGVKAPEGAAPIGADKYPLFRELVGSAQFMEFPAAVLEGRPYP